MKLGVLVAIGALGGACRAPTAQPSPPVAAPAPAARELVRFHLYKFGQRIGIEHARLQRASDGSGTVRTTFTFNDRGTDVPLAAEWQLQAGGAPSRYRAWGFLARGMSLDDRVERSRDGDFEIERQEEPIRRMPAPAAGFAATSGYAPVIGQELLVRAWLARGRPAQLALLPEGTVTIQARGTETFVRDGKPLALEHLAVLGLVWGRQDVWIDADGALAAVVTRDAEFDHFAAVRAGNEALVDELIRNAGNDAVAWLGEVAQRGTPPAGPFALVGARLVDGTAAPAIANATVIVDGDRIVAAGPRTSTPVPAGMRTIDVTGATIVPGLWDMHAHLQQVEQAAAYLAAGVTTVRDEGNILAFITSVRDAIDAGRGVGPRVIVDCLVDGDAKTALGTLRVNALDEVPAVIEVARAAGCAEIKIYSSVRPHLVAPLAAEAHRRGLRVTGHIPIGMNLTDALDAGFDGINHISFTLGDALPKNREELRKLSQAEARRRMLDLDLASPAMQQLFRRMAAQQTAYDPTLALYELMLHPATVLATREPGLGKTPRQLRNIFGVGMDPANVEGNARLFEKYLAAVRAMHEHGVTIVAGTDIGVPGHSLHRELELYVAAGFTPLEALQAATIVPARVLGKDRELGTVTAGKRADLLVVDGDPLTEIRALRNVRLVVARGRSFEPATMWKIAGFQP
jgi:imidazolonepropionase-like amidohydrolase